MNAVARVLPSTIAAPDAWADRIRATWSASVRAVIETGRLIAEAKAHCQHGDFLRLVETMLPFGANTAQRLMAIAAHERLANADHDLHLPSSWQTLYVLSRMKPDAFDEALAAGVITPSLERRQAQRLVSGGVQALRGPVNVENAKDEGDDDESAPLPEVEYAAAAQEVLDELFAFGVAPQGLDTAQLAMVAAACQMCCVRLQDVWVADTLSGGLRRRAIRARRLAIHMLHTRCSMSQPDACRPFGIEASTASYVALACTNFDENERWAEMIEIVETLQRFNLSVRR